MDEPLVDGNREKVKTKEERNKIKIERIRRV